MSYGIAAVFGFREFDPFQHSCRSTPGEFGGLMGGLFYANFKLDGFVRHQMMEDTPETIQCRHRGSLTSIEGAINDHLFLVTWSVGQGDRFLQHNSLDSDPTPVAEKDKRWECYNQLSW